MRPSVFMGAVLAKTTKTLSEFLSEILAPAGRPDRCRCAQDAGRPDRCRCAQDMSGWTRGKLGCRAREAGRPGRRSGPGGAVQTKTVPLCPRQKFLDIAITQGITGVKPDGMADEGERESVARQLLLGQHPFPYFNNLPQPYRPIRSKVQSSSKSRPEGEVGSRRPCLLCSYSTG